MCQHRIGSIGLRNQAKTNAEQHHCGMKFTPKAFLASSNGAFQGQFRHAQFVTMIKFRT